MAGWKTKLFGDNRLNFYGWLLGGVFVIGASLWFVVHAILDGLLRTPEGQILVAIYLVLLGILGLALQKYQSRLARVIDAADEESAA
ncbi:MAG: hypothetical protein ACYTGZ_12305 [Planctomycetota bacterium]|jgi:hypothetical protein